MKIGISVPRIPDPAAMKIFAQRTEELGFESILLGDHVVLPTDGTNQYPYTADGSFSSAADAPFLETMTLLGFLAACTETIKIGSTVIILPYRNPVIQAKMFASLDVLSQGRIICGVGVGWLEKEFEVLGVPYAEREYHGKYYQIDGILFYPKPVQKPHLPIWVGGHTRAALRRTAKYGDCWHTTRQTPEFVAGHLPYLRERIERAERDVKSVSVSLKRSLHFTDMGIPESESIRSTGALIAGTQEIIDDVYACCEIGIDQLTFDFRTNSLDDTIRVMEHLADRVLPVAHRLE